MIDAAVRAAQEADWAVVVLGDTVALTGESKSTATLDLQGAQIALLDALVDTGTPVIVVLIQSKPSVAAAPPPSAPRPIIEAFNPGMQGGRAIAELLTRTDRTHRAPADLLPPPRRPASRLLQPVRGQHGERYADLTQEPLFAFGEGLSYTTVEYSDLRLEHDELTVDEHVRATVTLTNTGTRPALETVQAYITDIVTSVTWAEQELKAFTQVTVEPGQSVDVTISIPVAAAVPCERGRPAHRRARPVRDPSRPTAPNDTTSSPPRSRSCPSDPRHSPRASRRVDPAQEPRDLTRRLQPKCQPIHICTEKWDRLTRNTTPSPASQQRRSSAGQMSTQTITKGFTCHFDHDRTGAWLFRSRLSSSWAGRCWHSRPRPPTSTLPVRGWTHPRPPMSAPTSSSTPQRSTSRCAG